VSTTACAATGSYGGTGFIYPLAAIGNGTSWTYEFPPGPPPSGGAVLLGVSCTAATACTAVGQTSIYSKSKAVVERYS
jgi:hypothetical protein